MKSYLGKSGNSSSDWGARSWEWARWRARSKGRLLRSSPWRFRAQYPPQQGTGGPPHSRPQQQQSDPGAARISFIHGDVSTQHSGSSDWAAATMNTPVVNGDHVSTGQNARAEIQLDHANILRMSDQSTANVVNLSRTQMQLQVGQGLVNYDVLKDNEANVEIETPNVAIRPQMGEGSYRILVNSDGETIVDVRKGSAEISTPQGSTRVERDQRITIQGNADNAQYQVSGAPGQGRLGQVEQRPRPHHRKRAKLAAHESLLHGQPGSGRVRPMEQRSRLRQRVVSRRQARAGRRTAMAAGCMNPTTAGPGFPMSPGAGRRITMAAGSFMAGTGAGGRARSMRGYRRFGRRRTFPSSDSAEEAGELTWVRFRRRLRQRGLAAVRPGRPLLPVVRPRRQPRERGQRLQHS